MSRDRVQAFKRVLAGWRAAGASDVFLADAVNAAHGVGVDPFELDRTLALAAASNPVAFFEDLDQTSEAPGPTSRGL